MPNASPSHEDGMETLVCDSPFKHPMMMQFSKERKLVSGSSLSHWVPLRSARASHHVGNALKADLIGKKAER